MKESAIRGKLTVLLWCFFAVGFLYGIPSFHFLPHLSAYLLTQSAALLGDRTQLLRYLLWVDPLLLFLGGSIWIGFGSVLLSFGSGCLCGIALAASCTKNDDMIFLLFVFLLLQFGHHLFTMTVANRVSAQIRRGFAPHKIFCSLKKRYMLLGYLLRIMLGMVCHLLISQ